MTQAVDAQADVPSPCVMACVVDSGHGFCLGCWRTLSEISAWHRYSRAEKLGVLAQINSRRSTHSTNP